MEYGKIIAVTGLPGLFELVSSKNDGAIVRSLEDKSTRFVSSRIHNFSHLESIEIYTVRDNVNLADVFKAMEGGSEQLPDSKDNNAVKKYFEKVFPDMDFERVYTSDMKKMVKWFSVLKANDVTIELRSEEPAAEEAVAETVAEPVAAAEEAPKKKATKAAPKKEKEPAAAEEEETVAKKAPAKKKAAPKAKAEDAGEEKDAAPKKKAAAKKKADK